MVARTVLVYRIVRNVHQFREEIQRGSRLSSGMMEV
jgi:hypothetical protein